jgi:hypothetical protein
MDLCKRMIEETNKRMKEKNISKDEWRTELQIVKNELILELAEKYKMQFGIKDDKYMTNQLKL